MTRAHPYGKIPVLIAPEMVSIFGQKGGRKKQFRKPSTSGQYFIERQLGTIFLDSCLYKSFANLLILLRRKREMRKILLAVLLVAFVAMPAYASVQNVKVSGWVSSTFLVRDNFDLGLRDVSGTPGTNFYQNLLITQAILRVDADLTDQVKATIALINERQWGDEGKDAAGSAFSSNSGETNTDVTIHLANATFGEFFYSPLTVIVGRQALQYGNSLIVGKAGPNNVAAGPLGVVAADLSVHTAYDAVRGILNYDPLTIDIFAAKIDSGSVKGARTSGAESDDDVNLYGITANYKLGDAKNSEVDFYFFEKDSKLLSAVPGVEGVKADTVYTPGVLVRTNPISGLNVSGEVAWQFGTKASTSSTGAARSDNQRREAMAAQIITSYAIPLESTKKWNPVVAGWGTYLSGDPNANEATNHACLGCAASPEEWTGWDPMFEDQSGGTIYNTLFDYTNAIIAGASLQVNPMEDLTAKLTLTGLWLSREINLSGGTPGTGGTFIMRQPDGTTVNPIVTTNRHIGNEIDLDLDYAYTEDVSFGFSYGVFMPGGLFDVNNTSTSGGNFGNNQNASQWLVNADVAF